MRFFCGKNRGAISVFLFIHIFQRHLFEFFQNIADHIYRCTKFHVFQNLLLKNLRISQRRILHSLYFHAFCAQFQLDHGMKIRRFGIFQCRCIT